VAHPLFYIPLANKTVAMYGTVVPGSQGTVCDVFYWLYSVFL